MATKSELTKKENLPGVMDDLGQDSMEEAKLNANKEIEHFTENIQKITEAKERFQKMWERDDRLYHIMMANPQKIVLTHKYEEVPEYWDIRLEQLKEKYEEDKFMAEAKLKQYDTQLSAIKEQIESTQELLEDIDGEL